MSAIVNISAPALFGMHARLVQELSRYAYRPGWTLEIVRASPPVPMHVLQAEFSLRVTGRVTDTYDHTKTVQVISVQVVPSFLIDERNDLGTEYWTSEFARWLQRALFDVERHESQEWLRRDGEIYDNPHKETKR